MAIHFETDGHKAIIQIDRLERRNSLDLDHFGMLANAWIRFRDDDDLWVAIITGKDDVFCVGADLKSFVPDGHRAGRRARVGREGARR